MDYLKRENENWIQFADRIISAKEDGLIDLDKAEIYELLFGEKLSSDESRKRLYSVKKVVEILKNEQYQNISDDKILKEYEVKKRELEKEKIKFYDERTSYKKMLRDVSRWEEVYEIIEKTIKSGDLPEINYEYKHIQHTDNDLMVSLNDLHFGANIDNAWNTYNSDICKERLEYYLNEILNIKQLHNSENCYVCANGDLINGNIHPSVLVSNRENIIEQIMGVSELISLFLAELSKHFNNVVFTVVAGNHSRLNTKDNSLKNERLDDLVPWYIKARLQNIDNIIINKNIDNTMSILDIRSKKYVNVHGDYDSGRSAIQSLSLMSGQNVYGVCCGHLHHNSMDYVDSIKVIMAGSFLGMDDYCITKRIVGIPQQLVCVCDDKGVRCSYDINF
jgi:predicted phosphodiesterase